MLFSRTYVILAVYLISTLASINIIVNAQISDHDPCSGQCQNGGVCTNETVADFLARPTTRNNDEKGGAYQLVYSETGIIGRDGNRYRCACEPGWTGTHCDIPFDSCSQQHDEGAGGNHNNKCHHGGRCIPGLIDKYGNEQLYCDCSDAYDEDEEAFYVGKYCEHKSINYCDEAKTRFCVNGGECNNGAGVDGPACICNAEYTGPHCQFKINSVPVCDLQCQNGGHCVFGEPSNESDPDRYRYWDHHEDVEDFMRCSCPDGFDGPTCEIEKKECGKGHCFHGSECIIPMSDDNDDAGFFCDCTTANMNSEVSFAGRYCQYQATSYCTKTGDVFCVNGGTCKADPDHVHEGCDCLPGFEGFSCEFRVDINNGIHHNGQDIAKPAPGRNNDNTNNNVNGNNDNSVVLPIDGDDDDEDPNLQYPGTGTANNSIRPILDEPDYVVCGLPCENRGVCRKGSKNYADEELNYIILDVDHLNASHTKNFEHCVCPIGFIGLQCEHKVEVCGENEHHCLHGSTCVSNEGFHSCDCSDTTSEGVYAGDSCEHKATSICTTEYNDVYNVALHTRPLSFCVNGGICVRDHVSGGDGSHAGCICLPGYDGPHCEFRINTEIYDQTLEVEDEVEQQVTEVLHQPDDEQQEGEQQQQNSANDELHNNNDDKDDNGSNNNNLEPAGHTTVHHHDGASGGAVRIDVVVFFIVLAIAEAVFIFISIRRQRQRNKQRWKRASSNDGPIPQRMFQSSSSSSTDRLMVDVTESSDLMPPVSSNGFHSSNGGGDGYGNGGTMTMEPSDSTPGGTDSKVLDLDRIEIV